MIKTKMLSFLNEMGFSDIQINIYNYLLSNKFGTINKIKTELNKSYSQVQHNLRILKEKKLVETSTDSKTKIYIAINPRVALNNLINKISSNFKERVKDLEEDIKIQESRFGRCVKDVTFYHYSDVNLAINNFHDLFENAKKEIIMTSLPPTLIKRLEPSLYNAFMRGVRIKLYFSHADFEAYENYLDIITDILKRIKIEIIQTELKTCQVVRYNDEIVNMGNIHIDRIYLNSILFSEDKIFLIDGFTGPYSEQAIKYLEILNVIKRIELEYPEPFQNVLDVIHEFKSIKTRDISSKSKVGGAKLREILDFLAQEGVVKEELIKTQASGRPKHVYSIIE